LGVVDTTGPKEPPPLMSQQIALKSGGTLLFYWLGNQQSYLWAITPKKTMLFTLPAAEEIEAAIQRYRESLETSGSRENAVLVDRDGIWLYRTLLAPAQSLIPKNGRVFIFADAGLNNLNFETLVVPDARPHFWIEDVSVICGSALRVLGRMEPTPPFALGPRTLLLIGNSISPSDKYPTLERAAEQVKTVSRHFSAERMRVIEQENATPRAYLTAAPERYSVIHFVAHGTASRTSPLDSAIVLSRPGAGNDLFKLYARDIVRHRVGADLVVISACYSAGDSAFAGEGLVGLSWAFQRAGARNVIAALGEVSAASALPLMDQFYGELHKGVGPDVALRNAKLGLLRDGPFRSPFYWAPFQLYGSGRMRSAH
jgi:CHAT domain-containing protein